LTVQQARATTSVNRVANRIDRHASLPQEYNDFLYALVGEEHNETPLSVLSLLVRLDLDPWEEAARLLQLPKGWAVRDLAAKISAIPTGCWQPSDCEPIAVRLIDRLHDRSRKSNSSPAARERPSLRVICALAFVWILFVAVLGAFSFEAYRRTTVSARATPPSTWVDPAPRHQTAWHYDLGHQSWHYDLRHQ
jgi:hypothetical protein